MIDALCLGQTLWVSMEPSDVSHIFSGHVGSATVKDLVRSREIQRGKNAQETQAQTWFHGIFPPQAGLE
ncbi:MAG: hypothetical protein ACE5QF_03895 [Thermoplasmata archaeon]